MAGKGGPLGPPFFVVRFPVLARTSPGCSDLVLELKDETNCGGDCGIG